MINTKLSLLLFLASGVVSPTSARFGGWGGGHGGGGHGGGGKGGGHGGEGMGGGGMSLFEIKRTLKMGSGLTRIQMMKKLGVGFNNMFLK